MAQAISEIPVRTLEERLHRGAQLLFDMEQRGEFGEEYEIWLERWVELLCRYEVMQAA